MEAFVETYPGSFLLPEMLYEQAELLSRMGRRKESLGVLLRLLETGGGPEENSTEGWLYWRQRAGNHFANQYYELGDTESALRIYQGLVVLNEEAAWQLPIIYQIALCFERMGRLDRAEESLQFILQNLESGEPETSGTSPDLLQQLEKNTRWRLEMLQWRQNLEGSLPASSSTVTQRPPTNPTVP